MQKIIHIDAHDGNDNLVDQVRFNLLRMGERATEEWIKGLAISMETLNTIKKKFNLFA